jgi:anti-anti-sigma factor
MGADDMAARITSPSDAATTIVLEGEIDLAVISELEAAIGEAARAGPPVIDMRQVTFIDSSGLHALHRAATGLDGSAPLVLLDPPARVLRVLAIVGLDRVPEIEVRGRQA